MAAPDSETGCSLCCPRSRLQDVRCLVYENAPEAGHLVFAGERTGLGTKLHLAARITTI
jgi:hypothetical protein